MIGCVLGVLILVALGLGVACGVAVVRGEW